VLVDGRGEDGDALCGVLALFRDVLLNVTGGDGLCQDLLHAPKVATRVLKTTYALIDSHSLTHCT